MKSASTVDRPVLLDASALVALFAGEPAMDEVRALMSGREAAVTGVNLIEAADRMQRRHSVATGRFRSAMSPLSVRRLPVDEVTAWRAADIRSNHYHRTRCPISLADSILLACAGSTYDVATTDGPVARVARVEGIGVIVLPDSSGNRAE